MKNITPGQVVEIFHKVTGEPRQLTFLPVIFPYYYPTSKENIFYKIDSRVLNGYTKGDIFIGLVELTSRSKRENKNVLQAINTRHVKGVSRRIRKKIKWLKKECSK